MTWFAQAPANIALIKYMGKKDDGANIPDNPSLSYTLNNLLSSVTLELYPGQKDIWEPLSIPGAEPFTLSKQAQERFLNHLSFLKRYSSYEGAFMVRSSNNFPTGAGLASSASSFAALTFCTFRALGEIQQKPIPSIQMQAALSRHGLGSSCRSFFSPWALWDQDRVEAIDLLPLELLHQVVIISHDEKKISSSLAHKLVKTSPYYPERAARATENLAQLLEALRTNNWHKAYLICWEEFQDMHRLFETCTEAFTYMTAGTQNVLKKIQALWADEQDGPLVTMDAGSNIHLLYKASQADLAQKFKCDHLIGQYDVL